MRTYEEIKNVEDKLSKDAGIVFILVVLYACLYGTVYGFSYYSYMKSTTGIVLVSIAALFIGIILLGLFAHIYRENSIGFLVFVVAMLSLPIYFGVVQGIEKAKSELSRMYGRSQ